MRVELKQVLEFVCVYMWLNLSFTFTAISYTHKHVNKMYSYVQQYLYFTHLYTDTVEKCLFHDLNLNAVVSFSDFPCTNDMIKPVIFIYLLTYRQTNKVSVFTSQEEHAAK